MRGRGGTSNQKGKQPKFPEEEPSLSSNAEETSSGSEPPSPSKVDAAGKLLQNFNMAAEAKAVAAAEGKAVAAAEAQGGQGGLWAGVKGLVRSAFAGAERF